MMIQRKILEKILFQRGLWKLKATVCGHQMYQGFPFKIYDWNINKKLRTGLK